MGGSAFIPPIGSRGVLHPMRFEALGLRYTSREWDRVGNGVVRAQCRLGATWLELQSLRPAGEFEGASTNFSGESPLPLLHSRSGAIAIVPKSWRCLGHLGAFFLILADIYLIRNLDECSSVRFTQIRGSNDGRNFRA